jgi:predicted esterase
MDKICNLNSVWSDCFNAELGTGLPEDMTLSTGVGLLIAAVAAHGAGASDHCVSVVREKLRVGDAIVHVSRPPRVAVNAPILVLYHGFGAPADAASLERAIPALPNAVTLYTVLPLTGDRAPPGGHDEIIRRQQQDYVGKLLAPVISSAAGELPALIAAVRQRFGNTRAKVGVFGFSAGGAAALASLLRHDIQIRLAIALNAPLSMAQAVGNWERVSGQVFRWSPESKRARAAYDLTTNARPIAAGQPNSSILLLQGDADPQFDPDAARVTAVALQAAYAPRQAVRVETIAGMGHQLDAFDHDSPASAAVKVREAFAQAFKITTILPCEDDARGQRPLLR